MSSTYKTTNLELNDWLPNDTSKREDFNNDNYKIDEWAGKVNSQLKYECAGGTATAITLNMPAILKDGYWKKFIAKADNGGAATTINGKPFYKVCSTNPPNLKKDRPYEAYYNLTGDCFFLKASATGTATPEQVLANVPYSNENYTDLVGTMPNRGAVTATLNAGGSYTIPKGYHNGSGKVTANSLATQMANNGVTLTDASQLISGIKAYSKTGQLLTGTATITSLGGIEPTLSGNVSITNTGRSNGVTINVPSQYSNKMAVIMVKNTDNGDYGSVANFRHNGSNNYATSMSTSYNVQACSTSTTTILFYVSSGSVPINISYKIIFFDDVSF